MTRLFDDAARFADDALEGFASAYGRYVRSVPGGVVRASLAPAGSVAVVIGGGAGHYPAFLGLVGRGMAHGAAVGNVFASPSSARVVSVARQADAGGGVLLSCGNYAGDLLNFAEAESRLIELGIDCCLVLVADDIASAPASDHAARRGIAGGVIVYKLAGAAADAGYALDAVREIASRAAGSTRSVGVAFSGATFPGANAPFFAVPDRKMAVGMGVHGEPGLSESDMPSAEELARLLVSMLLAEIPEGQRDGNGRVAVLLNGLGSTKYEELLVVFRTVSLALAEHGLALVHPEVGEFVTSLDMAGLSLTISWLDEELETLWLAPADAPGFRRPAAPPVSNHDRPTEGGGAAAEEPRYNVAKPTGEATWQLTEDLAAVLRRVAVMLGRHADALGELDARAGDGDHGFGMVAGANGAAQAAAAAAQRGAGLRTALFDAADAWSERAGGASGALWGAVLRSLAVECHDDAKAIDADLLRRCAARARAELAAAGNVELGAKTMLDALAPFCDTLIAQLDLGRPHPAAWHQATVCAARAAQNTATLTPTIGRARLTPERSVGHPDPGAMSFAIVVQAADAALNAPGESKGGDE